MEQVIAEVVLRAPGGGSVLDRSPGLTAEDLAASRPSEDTVRRARELLEAHGIAIEVAGPVGFTVSCDRATFEQVFRTRLEPQAGDAGPGAAAFTAERPPSVPDAMTDVVAAVVLPTAPELFG